MTFAARPYHLSDAGARLIGQFEGYRANAYRDVGNIWTIGYGSTHVNGVPVKEGDTIDVPRALKALQEEAQMDATFLESAIVNPLTQNQVDALISLCYNIGVGAFSGSTLRRTINARQPVTEKMFTDWNKVRVNGVLTPSNGITRRRAAEYALFMTP
mgnify:FL=1